MISISNRAKSALFIFELYWMMRPGIPATYQHHKSSPVNISKYDNIPYNMEIVL